MGVVARLPLLLVTAVLGNFTPSRPPGGPSGVPGEGAATAKCPECDEETDTKNGRLFWCADCGIWFDSRGKVRRRRPGS